MSTRKRLIGGNYSIKTETRDNREITNVQDFYMSEFVYNQVRDIQRDFPNAVPRTLPSSVYNCHGLTFASRRCFIFNSQEVTNVLNDDDYCEVELQYVKPGDIIIYYNNGDLEHSGVVVGLNENGIPRILSKWGSGKEFIHNLHECPYIATEIKYYRIIC